jgi:hypothetical protein
MSADFSPFSSSYLACLQLLRRRRYEVREVELTTGSNVDILAGVQTADNERLLVPGGSVVVLSSVGDDSL